MDQQVPRLEAEEHPRGGVWTWLHVQAPLVTVRVAQAEHSGDEGVPVEMNRMRLSLAGPVPPHEHAGHFATRLAVPLSDVRKNSVLNHGLQQMPQRVVRPRPVLERVILEGRGVVNRVLFCHVRLALLTTLEHPRDLRQRQQAGESVELALTHFPELLHGARLLDALPRPNPKRALQTELIPRRRGIPVVTRRQDDLRLRTSSVMLKLRSETKSGGFAGRLDGRPSRLHGATAPALLGDAAGSAGRGCG
mmetsp:Transcript_12690/g.34076  ORF Transcript_12690/g.34076 Transcript_12690/m.34076 type:complete len:249 (+) Transcript_12690:1423-2169(+)